MTNPNERSSFQAVTAVSRRTLFYAALFGMFVNILQLTVPLYMMQVFDRVIASSSMETLIWLTLLAGAALLMMSIADVARTRIMNRIGGWFAAKLGPELFERSIHAALDKESYNTEALRDMQTVQGFFSGQSLNALFDSPWVPVYLLFIYMLHPILGVVATVGALILFSLAALNEFATRKLLYQAGVATQLSFGHVSSAARNAEVVDAMGMLPGLAAKWLKVNGAAGQLSSRATDRAALILASSKFFRLAVQMSMLGAGAVLVISQDITAGAMIAGSIMMSRALAPVEQAIGSWRQLVGARAAFARLKLLFNTPARRSGSMQLPVPDGRLELESVSLMFPGATKPTIKGVSFACEPGTALAVIGPSASGKSTLARLMVGTTKPSAGHVRLDGADVYIWERGDFGRHVGYLPQDVELFAGTVRDNISRMMDAEPAAIVDAAKLAGVHEMILSLPDGYDTEIGAGGASLSGGQRQRVALARALFGRPRLIVLDEPNASLDSQGEVALAEAVLRMKADGATVVVIAHRPSILKAVDRILVLREGALEMDGPTAEVIAKLAQPTGPAAGPRSLEARGGRR